MKGDRVLISRNKAEIVVDGDKLKGIVFFIIIEYFFFINLIHQTSIVHKSARLGKGIVLCPFTYVFDNASIDDYVLFNVGTGAGHDAKVGKYSSLMGHVELCGHVEVGKECFFGSGARVLPSGKVGDNAFEIGRAHV